jgi:hypothetical protein
MANFPRLVSQRRTKFSEYQHSAYNQLTKYSPLARNPFPEKMLRAGGKKKY